MSPLVLRSTGARVAAWFWLAFAALNFLDIAIRGRNIASAVAAAVLLCGCGIAYVLGLRPRVTADESHVEVRNPLREVRIPWPAVRKIEAADALVVHYADAAKADRTARAWVLQTSPRARARQERRAERDQRHLPPGLAGHAEQLATRTPLDFAVEQLTELSQRARRTKETAAGQAIEAWSRPAVIALVAPAVLLVITVVLAVAT